MDGDGQATVMHCGLVDWVQGDKSMVVVTQPVRRKLRRGDT